MPCRFELPPRAFSPQRLPIALNCITVFGSRWVSGGKETTGVSVGVWNPDSNLNFRWPGGSKPLRSLISAPGHDNLAVPSGTHLPGLKRAGGLPAIPAVGRGLARPPFDANFQFGSPRPDIRRFRTPSARPLQRYRDRIRGRTRESRPAVRTRDGRGESMEVSRRKRAATDGGGSRVRPNYSAEARGVGSGSRESEFEIAFLSGFQNFFPASHGEYTRF